MWQGVGRGVDPFVLLKRASAEFNKQTPNHKHKFLTPKRRNTMKNKFFARLLILLIVAGICLTMFACSPRDNDSLPDDEIDKGQQEVIEDEVIVNKKVDLTTATATINETIENYHLVYPSLDEAEWFVMDFQIDFFHNYFWLDSQDKLSLYRDYTVVIKGNFNLKTNDESVLSVEIIDNDYNYLAAGFYYFDKTLYVNIAGQKYKSKEVNISQVGLLLSSIIVGNNLDLVSLVGGFLGGKLGLQGMEAIDSLLPIVLGLLFDGKKSYVTDYDYDDATGEYLARDISNTLKLTGNDGLLTSLISPDGSIAGLITVSWDTFGLPNLDPIMYQVLGISLESMYPQSGIDAHLDRHIYGLYPDAFRAMNVYQHIRIN